MFFGSWYDLLRVAVIGALSYVALVLLVRSSGKRTLAKWNAFDLIVTVALGSTLATVLLSSQVSLVEGVVGFAILVALQFSIAWLSLRSKIIRRIIKAEPALLYRDGQYLDEALRRERVTQSEVRAAVRGAGIADMEEVHAVVLETDGSVSVLRRSQASTNTAMVDVLGTDQRT